MTTPMTPPLDPVDVKNGCQFCDEKMRHPNSRQLLEIHLTWRHPMEFIPLVLKYEDEMKRYGSNQSCADISGTESGQPATKAARLDSECQMSRADSPVAGSVAIKKEAISPVEPKQELNSTDNDANATEQTSSLNDVLKQIEHYVPEDVGSVVNGVHDTATPTDKQIKTEYPSGVALSDETPLTSSVIKRETRLDESMEVSPRTKPVVTAYTGISSSKTFFSGATHIQPANQARQIQNPKQHDYRQSPEKGTNREYLCSLCQFICDREVRIKDHLFNKHGEKKKNSFTIRAVSNSAKQTENTPTTEKPIGLSQNKTCRYCGYVLPNCKFIGHCKRGLRCSFFHNWCPNSNECSKRNCEYDHKWDLRSCYRCSTRNNPTNTMFR